MSWSNAPSSAGSTAPATNILLIDDEAPVLRAMERIIRGGGFDALIAGDAEEALELLNQNTIDAVISDIQLPGMSGTEFLRKIRGHDLDIPVVFVTGAPSIESAAEAVKYGALQYLQKPFSSQELLDAAEKAVQMGRLATIRRRAIEAQGLSEGIVSDLAGTAARFDTTLDGLYMVYQPLFRSQDLSIYAYEALMRSEDPVLCNPGLVLSAAEQLDRVLDLGRGIRGRVARTLDERKDLTILLNLHPDELSDRELLNQESLLSKSAGRTVLEITERGEIQGSPELSARIRDLKDLGYRLAIDDLGSGYSSLSSFLSLDPDFVKVDISLVRNIDSSQPKQRLFRSIVEICRDMNIRVVAEGIETPSERDWLVEVGCDYLQGFLLGKPGKLHQNP